MDDVKKLEEAKRLYKDANADQRYVLERLFPELRKYSRKPAEWNAEDEQNLNACLSYLPDEFLARWLKDVIHREYDEPVWSEEVERLIKEASEYLRKYANKVQGGNSKVYIQSLADRVESLYCPLAQLKSGGSQVMKRWKPSKKQMEALSKALSLARVNGEGCEFDLRTLQGDLKKLMEE